MASPALPNLLIIGGMKCGTTSLHYYLSLHPEIQMSKIKELWYFVESRHWSRGQDWYMSHFDGRYDVRGEASTGYTMFPSFKEVPQRIAALLPDVKLIYIMRDPLPRLLSEYRHHVNGGAIQRPLPSLIADGYADDRIVARSRYAYQLEQYLPYFDLNQIHIITTERLAADRQRTLAGLFRFLQVDDSFSNAKFDRRKNVTAGKRRLRPPARLLYKWSERHLNRRWPGVQREIVKKLCFPLTAAGAAAALDDPLREQLLQQLKPDVERLRRLTGYAFDEWSI